MTKQGEELIEKLKTLGRSPWIVQVATVKEVDTTKLSCTVELLSDETEIPNIRLKAGIDEIKDGLVQIPKVNSVVLIAMINFNIQTHVIVAFSEVEEAIFFNGENGGLVIIGELVTKLNNLESKVNDLISALQGVVIPLAPSGTYPFAPLFADILPLDETTVDDLENDKVKH